MPPVSIPSVASLLTPPGRGAIATIAVEGPEAVEIVSRHFQAASGKRLTSSPLRRILFGKFATSNESAEELVVAVLGPQRVEIHCHGGIAATRAILRVLSDEGASVIPWQEFAAKNEDDSIAAAARTALAAARTERTAAILLDQYQGALRRTIDEIHREMQLAAEGQSRARTRMQRLLDLAPLGMHLTIPWRVVMAGPPNVGKSSLVNALLGYQRSIVFDQPGTTRDVLSATTAIDGWPIELIDTAGLRETDDALESAGVKWAESAIQNADLVLRVVDVSEPAAAAELAPTQANQSDSRHIVVFNKLDLDPDFRPPLASSLAVSALTGQGLDVLCRTIARTLVPSPPQPGEAVPFTPEQVEFLRRM